MLNFSEGVERVWRARGVVAILLLPLSALFAAIVWARKLAYRHGIFRSVKLPVPVVVVGNLVAGGAGKTPTVLSVVGLLQRHGFAPGILSRGYGGHHKATLEVTPNTSPAWCGDEPLLLRRRTGVPVVVGRDRVAAAQALLAAHPEVTVLVCDDGLQHLRLARDLQIIVFDERGAGNRWVLPAGPLREPLPRGVPPHSVVLYNAPHPSTHLPGRRAHRQLSGVASLQAWWEGSPVQLSVLNDLRTKTPLAVAGVAHPERFFMLLRQAGLQIQTLGLPDHFAYSRLPWDSDTKDVIVTEKDAVKLDPSRVGRTRVWVAALDFVPEPAFDDDVLECLHRERELATPPRHGNSIA